MECSILSGHRRVRPFGIAGGQPGQIGVNKIFNNDGTGRDIGGNAHQSVGPGDAIEIITPTGGGWGDQNQ
jgi:5-oxoprolinase (ATP-hydrolysing)